MSCFFVHEHIGSTKMYAVYFPMKTLYQNNTFHYIATEIDKQSFRNVAELLVLMLSVTVIQTRRISVFDLLIDVSLLR